MWFWACWMRWSAVVLPKKWKSQLPNSCSRSTIQAGSQRWTVWCVVFRCYLALDADGNLPVYKWIDYAGLYDSAWWDNWINTLLKSQTNCKRLPAVWSCQTYWFPIALCLADVPTTLPWGTWIWVSTGIWAILLIVPIALVPVDQDIRSYATIPLLNHDAQGGLSHQSCEYSLRLGRTRWSKGTAEVVTSCSYH